MLNQDLNRHSSAIRKKKCYDGKKNWKNLFCPHLLCHIQSEIFILNQILASHKSGFRYCIKREVQIENYSSVAEKDNHHLENYIPDENFWILRNFD